MNRIQSAAPKTGDDLLEQVIKNAGANVAPRITPHDIENNITSEHYFTAAQGVIGNLEEDALEIPEALDLLTFCVLVLKNGFTVTGESACASPENFNADIGKRIAREQAINKVWAFMGYALKSQLSKEHHV